MNTKPSRFLLLLWFTILFSVSNCLQQNVAFLTGASGRTGEIVAKLLHSQGFQLRIFCRDEQKARAIFDKEMSNIQYIQGDLNSKEDIQMAFEKCHEPPLTHIVFMAGGEEADYRAVNYLGVAECAKLAAKYSTIKNFVLISSAWATKPFSIASLLFNSIYPDTVPMASHYLGEQALRRASAASTHTLNYAILRAGGLNSDENYAKKYPDAVGKGLTYNQGDSFTFLGVAGRPGMARSQLAHAVASAANVNGQYTVEVTGSGVISIDDSSIYGKMTQDDIVTANLSSPQDEERIIMTAHTQAVQLLKQTAILASLGAVGSILVFGWVQGLFSLLALDAILLLVWSQFYSKREADAF